MRDYEKTGKDCKSLPLWGRWHGATCDGICSSICGCSCLKVHFQTVWHTKRKEKRGQIPDFH